MSYSDIPKHHLPHLFAAAFFAIALRLAGDSAAARAFPPLAPPSLPSATAAGFFVDSGSACAFPVDMSTIILASWFGSRGRFGLLIPTLLHPSGNASSLFAQA